MDPNTSSESLQGVVFVATDFSTSADEALRQGHMRAQARGAKLVVCHVVPSQLGVNMLFPQRSMHQADAQLALDKRALSLLIERTVDVTGRAPEQFEPIVAHGSPSSVIVDRAEQAGAELIVIGSRGQTGASSNLLGSVAGRVVRYAHCPVLIARPDGRAARILAATDLSDPSLPALAAAAREAAGTQAHVTALHCLELVTSAAVGPEYGLAFAPAAAVEILAEVRSLAEQRLAEAAQQVGLAADLRVVEGTPSTTILDTARDLDADLVVLGTRGRTGLRRVVLGSVAEAVIRDAPCSVLAVRLGQDSKA